MKVVTFCCSSMVHVYNDGSCFSPSPPYKNHSSVEDAIKHLKERGILNPKIEAK